MNTALVCERCGVRLTPSEEKNPSLKTCVLGGTEPRPHKIRIVVLR